MTDQAVPKTNPAAADDGTSARAPGRVDVGRTATAPPGRDVDWKRVGFLLLGAALFLLVYYGPTLSPALDPQGKAFPLTREGKAALGLFFLALTWWVTEVIPIGVTSIAIGTVQALFLIRPARVAFTDFMDPSVWFIFASLIFGIAFTKTGLTRRLAYRTLSLVGERTSMIYLGCFVMTAALTLFMAHTAVAATIFPLLLAVYALYTEEPEPTRFGKGLFIGMAFVAGAGSIVTLLGSARAAVAIGFFRDITGKSVSFFELTYYMFPVGALMTVLIWVFILLYYPPERKTIPGLRDRVRRLYASLGPTSRNERWTLAIVLATIAVLSVRTLVPALSPLDKSAIILTGIVLLFALRVVRLEDLEDTSWNIVLLFGGAMSLGFCLWQTGAAGWLAVTWLGLLHHAHWFLFVMGIAAFVLTMTNLIMNVAAIAITMPVALVIAPYVGVAPEIILFASLVAAGMPFLLLIGAAPNAIAYASNQFTPKEFFRAGIPVSLILLVVLGLFVWLIWPAMGMPVLRAS
jgi:sodium-dependent dicarboxylate transporter 2/3/5